MSDASRLCQPSAKLRAPSKRSPKPADGRCECCGSFVGRPMLVWHHCHDCGAELCWACDACNTALTEHILYHWQRVDEFVRSHTCAPRLLDVTPTFERREPRSRETRQLFLSNGAGDGRYVMVSTRPGWITAEQLGVLLGVNANTARQHISGRKSRRQRGEKHDGTWLISITETIELLRHREEVRS